MQLSMPMSADWQPTASLQALQQRDVLTQTIRRYFQDSNSLEVSTPSMSFAANTDPHIESFSVNDGNQTLWLHTSPEFAMKRLLAAYAVDVHQIACVYRRYESGRHNNREFTLVEWYRLGFTLEQLIQDALMLINAASEAIGQSERNLKVVSYQAAVKQLCGVYPHQLTLTDIAEVFTTNQRSFPDSLLSDAQLSHTIDDALTLLVDEFIVNTFCDGEITALIDYPASQASLARTYQHANGQQVARRAEIFIGSVELANGFEELTDASEQAHRFATDNAQRAESAKPEMPIDTRLIKALSHGLPNCAGMAMGLDRLLMVLTGNQDLASVVAFSGTHV